VIGVIQTRDSDALERSNFRVAERMLSPHADDYETHRFRHWGPGWYEIILVRPNSPAHAIAQTLTDKLRDYPILNEDDHSELEQEEAYRVWSRCYSPTERIAYMREHWDQFSDRCSKKYNTPRDAWRNLLACVRGKAFYGYASELIG
jgi:hypothetical protein